MTAKTDTIEVDETTAAILKARAVARGVSVSQIVAELVTPDALPAAIDPQGFAELERRWKAIEAGAATIPNGDVVRWLDTWGTPAFRLWRDR
jgi:hypothetical protein